MDFRFQKEISFSFLITEMALPKILITGGAGYLGYHIALVLKAAGNVFGGLFEFRLNEDLTFFPEYFNCPSSSTM